MSSQIPFTALAAQIAKLQPSRPMGRVRRVDGGVIHVGGLGSQARTGDRITLRRAAGDLSGEVVQIAETGLIALLDDSPEGIALHDPVILHEAPEIAPSAGWIGRVIDPMGNPLDGKPLLQGMQKRALRAPPPPAAARRPLGGRLHSGMCITNTMLPLARGQRMGILAGAGVGKSSLLGHLAKHMQADVVVLALIGERGRELRHFIDTVLGPEGAARAVTIAATSDQSPLIRRRCAWTAMSVAEYFRDQGKSVLLLADSITRFAEAHREVAVAAGESPVLRGFPPSTAHQITSLCERAGPGQTGQGDITALFSVLVAGSDMDEPIADIMRGVLDGHIVMDRTIAERGRFPAIDVLRSVSRCLPDAASDAQNKIIADARRLLGAYEKNTMMISAGLYTAGGDPLVDQAIAAWPELDAFFAKPENHNIENSFAQLALILRRAQNPAQRPPAN
ncbi:MAG: FliI/YscN family ATPase [Sulfitobacter sp.]